jgi:hypothetical protein
MEIRPIVLRQELMEAYGDVQRQISAVKDNAMSMGLEPHEMRDPVGGWVLIPLLAARVQVLHSLTLLNKKGDR